MLAEIQRGLAEAGMEDCRFLVVGDGSERAWLQTNLRNCTLTGTLRGAELAVPTPAWMHLYFRPKPILLAM